MKWKAPAFHVGTSVLTEFSVDELVDEREDAPSFPWDVSDVPETKFRKLHQAVLDTAGQSRSDPSLADIFDTYFQTLWTLALSAPIDYVQHDPFKLKGNDGVHFFELSNVKGGQSAELSVPAEKTVGTVAKLQRRRKTGFAVYVDDVQLLRPISYLGLPKSTKASWTEPLMFVGKCKQDLKSFPEEATGGPTIAFQAYFYWAPKIVPKEHNGVLLRINDASGTLFDDAFMRYEVQEKVRLRQITAEIFVEHGLDSALNIDRESFNFSHPHFQFIAKWTHSALRQIANRHKKLLAGAQSKKRARDQIRQSGKIKQVVVEAMEELGVYAPDVPATVEFTEEGTQEKVLVAKRRSGVLAFRDTDILPQPAKSAPTGKRQEVNAILLKERAAAVAQILDAYGILEELEYEDQEHLIRAICRVFITENS